MNNAVQLWDGNLSVITRPMPHVQSGLDVIVKITYAAVSGTDLDVLEGKIKHSKSIILGHQFVGIVKEMGADVKHVSVGDRVVVNPHTSCNMCDFCLKGQPSLCKVEGKSTTIGLRRNGGWAQFCRLTAKNVIPLPHQVTFEQALFTEPLSCVLNGWQTLCPVKDDVEILICGAGNTGLLWASFLHFRGYREVVVCDILKGRQKIAQKLDFGYQVVTPEILISESRNAEADNDEEWGFDIIIDSTSDSKSLEQNLRLLRQGGKLLLLGAASPSCQVTLNPYHIYKKELQILTAGPNPLTFTSAVQIIKDMGDRYVGFDKLGIRTFQLQEYMAAVETMRSGEISKAVFEY